MPILSIKSAPAAEQESPAIPLVLDIPEGTDEAVKAALTKIAQYVADDAAKAGARHSRADNDRVQQVHDHSCALGALCHGHNTPAPTEGDEDYVAPKGKPVKKPATKTADVEGSEASDQAEALGVPLDKLVEAVRAEFYELRTELRKAAAVAAGKDPSAYYYDWDDDLVPCCEAVYDGYAIARIELAYYKVPYSVVGTGIELAAQDTWEQVKQDWVTKNIDLWNIIKSNQRKRELGAVKMLGANRLGNYLMVWGDEKNRDLYGEYFTSKTEGLKSIFDYIGKIPALYQHAMDGVVKYDPVGTIDVLEIDEVGLWMETQLDLSNEYSVAVQELARRKALGASSGALPGSRKVRPNGEIWRWAIVEGSFTPTPAEPRLRELGVSEVKSIYAEIGLEFPEEALKSNGTGDEESRQATDNAAIEDERLKLLELSARF